MIKGSSEVMEWEGTDTDTMEGRGGGNFSVVDAASLPVALLASSSPTYPPFEPTEADADLNRWCPSPCPDSSDADSPLLCRQPPSRSDPDAAVSEQQ
ncbi:hypothetical protein ZIOFF_044005 [Zingiber officinale]|uniref:Uncharacterized protein n=1 Tax=Zingiber officinale TaxID=94328 RepID=A0A8J5GBG4_ZINOF|nr:hypothetical protein ZIOFF_044005 [Zingiber officinale]